MANEKYIKIIIKSNLQQQQQQQQQRQTALEAASNRVESSPSISTSCREDRRVVSSGHKAYATRRRGAPLVVLLPLPLLLPPRSSFHLVYRAHQHPQLIDDKLL